METIVIWLLGTGGLFLLLNLLLGIVEAFSIRTIRPPKQRSFTYIRLEATQFQTVFAPAMAALISGLFVSLSASFIHSGLTNESEEWQPNVGVIVFFVGVVVLMVTLRLVLDGVGEPKELTRDPFSMRAAAEEIIKHPRQAALGTDDLEQQLDEWEQYISARSMSLSSSKTSERLDRNLNRAAKKLGFWASTWCSYCVYQSAVLRFPFRFGWPLLGFAFHMSGAVLLLSLIHI